MAAIGSGGIEQARSEAIQDARRQAALSAAALVESSSTMDTAGGLQESMRLTPAASVSSHTVLREWRADGLLHVQIRAEVQPNENTAAAQTERNLPVRTPVFKKKVAVSRFHVVNSLQVEDIANIWDGYPLELLRRLEMLGRVLPVNNIASLLSVGSAPNADSPANREVIRRIAERTGSQFVISGSILDAGFGKGSIRPYGGWQGNNEDGPRSEIALPWPNLAVGLKPGPSERRLEVEVFLHDGLTGALIARHRASAQTEGRVTVGRDKPFASAAFFATPFGHAAERLIDAQVKAIANDLACLPFMANIVRIQGKKIYLDAGGTSGLAPGDKLTVYRKSPNEPISSLSGATALGIPEAPVTTLTLREVQPLFAQGDLAADPAEANIQIGDVARFEAPPAGK